ncbi:MAG TPA: ASCH domain-containing protein [Candidatus Nanopelagicales bacterium]|nr:ASCH domain-containing protein [Candidatus Nanopelagicales bacterium]
MTTVAILSIKPVYAQQILAGTKTIELRRSAMGLKRGDLIIVYISSPEQRLGMWFRVRDIEALPVDEMWARYHDRLGIDQEPYLAYFEGAPRAIGLHVSDLHPFEPGLPLPEIRQLVPGFVPPQGMLVIRDIRGRYQDLLARLPSPLPTDIFPQLALFQEARPAAPARDDTPRPPRSGIVEKSARGEHDKPRAARPRAKRAAR